MNAPLPAQINVLLVDDSAFALGVGQRVLRAAGVVSILQAPGGREALHLIDSTVPAIDVVFCDLMMPDMDGIQMIRQVATLAAHPAFVFLSGGDAGLLSAAEDTARARGLRVLGSIEKPLTPDAVRRVLAQFADEPIADRTPDQIIVTPLDLDTALERDRILLHFQPKVSLVDRHVTGFEALARLRHPDRGMIMPDDFIAVAEGSGRIAALTARVTTLALRQCAAWSRLGMHTNVSINLSAFMLVDLDLPDRMAGEATRYNVNPRQMILEITESGLFQDAANTLDILTRLHMKGFPLSIDDFGSGYSSMDQLRHLPFAELKIDRAFVHDSGKTPKAQAILESSAGLGRSLDMTVVAEGVETQSDWDQVRAIGVDLAQGYFIAKPMAAEAIPDWLADWSRGGLTGPDPTGAAPYPRLSSVGNHAAVKPISGKKAHTL
jgi:EAL domain-containing protein (putative c-di-GMP-specific phosphodiesterase class I)/CheY-like chemotaxis protein